MARIRSIHPGIFTDVAWVSLAPLTRWFGIGLLTEADDQGVFKWESLGLRMRLLAGDNADASAMLTELEEARVIARFDVGGRCYGAIRNFRRFQRPRKPNAIHPLTEEMAAWVGFGDAPEDDEGGGGDEPDDAGGGGGSARRQVRTRASSAPPPLSNAASAEPKRVQGDLVPPKSGNPPQMEDGGGKREDGEENPPSLRSGGAGGDPPPPPDARTVLWSEGLARLRRMTGKSDGSSRAQLGKWLKQVRDDCALLSRVLFEAEDARPGDPTAWIEAALRVRTTGRAGRGRDHSWMADAARELGLGEPYRGANEGRVVVDAETSP